MTIMKVLTLLPFVLPVILAAPTGEEQAFLSDITAYSDLTGSIQLGGISGEIIQGVQHIVHGADGAEKVTEKVEQWFEDDKEFVKQNGLVYELVTHTAFPDHQLRIKEPTLCDPSVKQYSGYLDIADDKHLFFWFFESRGYPLEVTTPLTMWLNGGPGCSSSMGLLLELGPCSIRNGGKNTTRNKYSWNLHSNMIFLDQPVNVGYSYGDSSVSTSPVVGQDVYAFMELFVNRFPQYAEKPFHLAGESYAGTYVPNIANVIYHKNKDLELAPNPRLKKINLTSIMLGNGMTDNYVQLTSIPDYLCEGPYPIFDDPNGPECTALRIKLPTCQRLIKACRNFPSKLTCVPATLYCYQQLYGPVQQSGRNPYDARRTCDREKDGQLCYKQIGWIDSWLNDPKVKAELGVNPDLKFESCNMAIDQAFMIEGDAMRNTPPLLTDLVNDGIRLLVYAGNADMMCNYIGNERWVEALDHDFHKEFIEAETEPWVTNDSEMVAGTVRSAGYVTFVTVYDAGHMVPLDQPEAAVDLFTRWIHNLPLTE